MIIVAEGKMKPMTENKPIVIEFRGELIELGRLNLITGDNGLGKTMLLDEANEQLASYHLLYANCEMDFATIFGRFKWNHAWGEFIKEYQNNPYFKQDLEKALPDAESYFPFIAPYMPKGVSRMFGLLCLVWQHYKYSPYVLLIDDIELHLSPQLQRLILPAVLKLIPPNATLLVTTHSPLVLASVEPYFDEEQDKLFHFSLVDREIKLEEQAWVKHGDVVNWLTSDVFGLKQARSVEAEQAIDAANTFMSGESLADFPAHLQNKADIHKELCRLLPGHDHFWPRWVVTAGIIKSK